MNPTTKQQALAVQGECKALIVGLLVQCYLFLHDCDLTHKFALALVSRAELACWIIQLFTLQEHFSSAQLEGEPADDTEALGKAVEEMLDDVLERVDTSLDAARALLKAAKAPGPGTMPAPEAGLASAARPVAGECINLSLNTASWNAVALQASD